MELCHAGSLGAQEPRAKNKRNVKPAAPGMLESRAIPC